MQITPSQPSQPSQSRSVTINGHAYAWEPARGLDPAAVLEVLAFVRRKAWAFSAWGGRVGLEVDDLVQEGVAGALKAAARFDPEAGAGFLTYAAWWIEAAMKDAMGRAMVRTPEGAPFALVHSLDAPMGGEDGRPVHQDWQRDDQPGPHELAAVAEDRERIRRALPHLDRRDREVLVRHMGLDGRTPQSFQSVAQDLGITRQRVGQIIDRARKDLRREL